MPCTSRRVFLSTRMDIRVKGEVRRRKGEVES
jgi:hypothetical protein